MSENKAEKKDSKILSTSILEHLKHFSQEHDFSKSRLIKYILSFFYSAIKTVKHTHFLDVYKLLSVDLPYIFTVLNKIAPLYSTLKQDLKNDIDTIPTILFKLLFDVINHYKKLPMAAESEKEDVIIANINIALFDLTKTFSAQDPSNSFIAALDPLFKKALISCLQGKRPESILFSPKLSNIYAFEFDEVPLLDGQTSSTDIFLPEKAEFKIKELTIDKDNLRLSALNRQAPTLFDNQEVVADIHKLFNRLGSISIENIEGISHKEFFTILRSYIPSLFASLSILFLANQNKKKHIKSHAGWTPYQISVEDAGLLKKGDWLFSGLIDFFDIMLKNHQKSFITTIKAAELELVIKHVGLIIIDLSNQSIRKSVSSENLKELKTLLAEFTAMLQSKLTSSKKLTGELKLASLPLFWEQVSPDFGKHPHGVGSPASWDHIEESFPSLPSLSPIKGGGASES